MPGKARFPLLVLFIFCVALDAPAQPQPTPVQVTPVQIASWPEGYVWLDKGWRFQVGDDPAYAQPDFDDSQWRVVHLSGSDRSTAGLGIRWYRLKVQVPLQHPPLAVYVGAYTGNYQLFVNGKPAGETGIVSHLLVRRVWPQPILLPEGVNEFEFALRTRNTPFIYSDDRERPNLLVLMLGTNSFVSNLPRIFRGNYLEESGFAIAVDSALLFAAIAALGFYLFQRRRAEYQWLGLYLGLLGAGDLGNVLCAGPLPIEVNAIFADPVGYIVALLQIEFTFAFAMQRMGRGWRIYEILLVITALAAIPSNLMGGSSTAYDLLESVLLLIPSVGMPVLLLAWFRKGNREAGWLIIPSLFPGFANAMVDLGYMGRVYLHYGWLGSLPTNFHAGSLNFGATNVAYLLFLLAIGIVMFLRFTRVSEAEARAAAELDAAREMQQKLVPAELPKIEGCSIAASYFPAAEVGGDFYQVLPQADGSALLVVGDVSGKGLKAAMTGTFALGALRMLARLNPSPAELLAGLNEEIAGAEQAGFITMICARIARDGDVALANAGHLHPYLNGAELEIESGIPLGVAAGARYAETQVRLAAGDTLTFLSDGVVEAKRPTGELFGFERTQAISGESAQQIAEAARTFGQEDDITVVRLFMSPVFAGMPVAS